MNDSEELSSSESEEDEDEEEEESDEEECNDDEDSGSEVEIIQEIQGNGSLRGLPASSAFLHEENNHFLSALSEQDAAQFSLIPPGVEMKVSCQYKSKSNK